MTREEMIRLLKDLPEGGGPAENRPRGAQPHPLPEMQPEAQPELQPLTLPKPKPPAPCTGGDYIDPADGLKHCGLCRTPKEAFYPPRLQLDGRDRHPIRCRCAAEQLERLRAEAAEEERRRTAAALRKRAFRDIPGGDWRFETAPAMTPQLEKARRYAAQWERFRQEGTGLLLFGDVGTGKTYAACCIANALMERGISALCVGLSDVVNRMQGNFGADRDKYMKALLAPELLVLDDLGAERSTSTGRERVFDVIDRRVLSGKPMLITTNLPLAAMRKPALLEEQRIYDRILSACVPIRFAGESFRRQSAAQRVQTAAALLLDPAEGANSAK